MNLENFTAIKQEYDNLDYDSFNEAYVVMKKASAELVYLETEKALVDKEVNRLKAKAEMVEAGSFLEYAKTNPIGKSEKLAVVDGQTFKAWDEYFDAEKSAAKLKSLISFLTRVYFDCKSIFEHGNKSYRTNKGGE